MSTSAPLKRVSRACDYCRKKRHPKGAKNPDGTLGGGRRKRGPTKEQTQQDVEMQEPMQESIQIQDSIQESTHSANSNAEQQRVQTPPRPWTSTNDHEITPLFQTSDITADFDQYAHDLGLVLAPSWPPNPLSSLSLDGLDAMEDPVTVSSLSPYPTHLPTPRLSHVGPSSSVFQSIDLGHTAANSGPFASTSHQVPRALPQARSAHELFLRKGPTDSKFIGMGSVGSTLSECLRHSISANRGSMEDTILNHLVNGIRHVDELALSAAFEKPPLPPRDFAERGVSAYYNCLHLLYPIMEERFQNEWYQIYEDNNYPLSPVTYSRFCLVVSVGNLVSPSRWDTDTWETAQRLQEQAWSLVDQVMASPFMDSLQVMLLQTVFLLYCGKTGIAWVTCGMAVRIAQSLGLHQPTPPQLKLSAEDISLRSRLWSVAYTLDAFLSLSEGRPSAVTGSPNFASSYRLSDQECLAMGAKSSIIPVHEWLINLAAIANEIPTLLRSGDSLVGTLARIAEIDAKLLAWKDAIPMESRPDQQILADGSLHYIVAMLHLKYHNLMRTLHWISLNLSSEDIGDDISRLGARVRSSESICLNASRSVIEVLNGASSRRIGGRLGGFIIPYCMAAISTFYRQIVKDPGRHSARTNLEHMRNGTLHITTLLDGIGPKRHFRALFEEMLRIAEDVVSKAPTQSIILQQEGTALSIQSISSEGISKPCLGLVTIARFHYEIPVDEQRHSITRVIKSQSKRTIRYLSCGGVPITSGHDVGVKSYFTFEQGWSVTTTQIIELVLGQTLHLKMPANFRDFVPGPDHPRVQGLDKIDPQAYSSDTLDKPVVREIVSKWSAKLREPYVGITSNGKCRENLFELADEGAPIEQMVTCANHIKTLFTSTELGRLCHEVDSDDWRKWSNPEFLIYRTGLRLENMSDDKVQAILALVQASTSPVGYTRVMGAMKTNEFLGELCNAKTIMNKGSYQFSLYGSPSLTEPWGYSLFGHHLSLNIFVLGKQMTASPIFIGAEPNVIDSGPDAGVRILDAAGDLPLALMQSLPHDLQQKTQIFKGMHDESMPDDRWNPADQRHLGGAFQDNRTIPYEGIKATSMPQAEQDKLLQVISFYVDILPSGPYSARMQQIQRHWTETFFCWIGGYGDEDAFYYRIQSPVIMIEFDHHSGVFLLNKEPAKYHIHTIVRTPNGNDYGREWLKMYRERSK